VVVVRIEGVAAVLKKFAGFDGLIGFVGMQRTPDEVVGSEPERGQRNQCEG
jgi:hypothetical protein